MLIKKTLLATTLLLGLTKAYAGCSVHDHLCSYHALGTPTTSYNQNQDTSLVIFSAATQVGGGTNNTVDFDNHVLLPDQTIDLSTGQVSSTEPFVYSTTSYGANNPSAISEWNTADTQPRHVYPSQYRVDFNQLTTTAKHTGDYNGGEKNNIPDATGCPNLGVSFPNCEAVVINKNVPTGTYSQKVQMFNFHELDDPSAEIVVGAYATGQGTIISQSHLPSGATTAATNPADATLTENGVVYQTINLSGDQAQSGQFDYAFYNRGFDPHASGTLSFDHKVYHDKGYQTYNKYDYKTNTVNTYRKKYYAYDTNRQTIDGETSRVNNQIVQYGKTYTSSPKIINTQQLPTIGIYQDNELKQVSTENASFNPLTQRWEKNTPIYGPTPPPPTSIGSEGVRITTILGNRPPTYEEQLISYYQEKLDDYFNNYQYDPDTQTLLDREGNIVLNYGHEAVNKELTAQTNILHYEKLTGLKSKYPKRVLTLDEKRILREKWGNSPIMMSPEMSEVISKETKTENDARCSRNTNAKGCDDYRYRTGMKLALDRFSNRYKQLDPLLKLNADLGGGGSTKVVGLFNPNNSKKVLDSLKKITPSNTFDKSNNTNNILKLTQGLNSGTVRIKPGTAFSSRKLRKVTGSWFKGDEGQAGMFPKQVAEKMNNKRYNNFKEFREDFWKIVSEDKYLVKNFNKQNIARMRKGLAPFVKDSQKVVRQGRGRRTYELDHTKAIKDGGSLYDMGNIIIRTPLNHINK